MLTSTASELYDENTLNDLMSTTVINDIVVRKSKIENLWAKAFDNESIFFLGLLYSIIFSRPGRNFIPMYKIHYNLLLNNYSR